MANWRRQGGKSYDHTMKLIRLYYFRTTIDNNALAEVHLFPLAHSAADPDGVASLEVGIL